MIRRIIDYALDNRFLVIGIALWAIGGSENGFRLFYLLFVPCVVAAVRHGLDGACFSLAATTWRSSPFPASFAVFGRRARCWAWPCAASAR